ncbi:MAG: tetratricopeptide repeat protein [Calditrichaceae bacterium]
MKRSFFLIILMFLSAQLLFGQSAVEKDPAAGQAYNEGNNFVKKQKYNEAVNKYLEAIKADNNFPQAYYMLGYAYKKTGQYDKAENSYRQAIKLDSQFEKAYIALAYLQSALQKDADAMNTYKAVLAFNETSSEANFGLGKLLFDQKENRDAVRYLEKSVKSDPTYSLGFNVLGLAYQNLREFDKSVDAFENAIKTEKKRIKQGDYYYRLGVVYLAMKKYNQAEEALNTAVGLSTSSTIKAGANFNLAEVYKGTGQTQKAIQYYKMAASDRSWKQAAEYEIEILTNPDKYSY